MKTQKSRKRKLLKQITKKSLIMKNQKYKTKTRESKTKKLEIKTKKSKNKKKEIKN